jgi:hypothetical protein
VVKWELADPNSMKEGFFSNAFTDKPLTKDAAMKMKSDLTDTKPLPINPAADPRPLRRSAVLAYLESLMSGEEVG